jgi:hypothetical protein
MDQNTRLFEFRQNELNQTIENMHEMLYNERETREELMGKFENEQKQVSTSTMQTLHLKAKLQNAEIDLSNAKAKI